MKSKRQSRGDVTQSAELKLAEHKCFCCELVMYFLPMTSLWADRCPNCASVDTLNETRQIQVNIVKEHIVA